VPILVDIEKARNHRRCELGVDMWRIPGGGFNIAIVCEDHSEVLGDEDVDESETN